MSKFLKAFLFASVIIAPFAASAVTVASWGGAYTESQKKAYADTYSDPGSIVFENYNGGLGETRAQVESGNGGSTPTTPGASTRAASRSSR